MKWSISLTASMSLKIIINYLLVFSSLAWDTPFSSYVCLFHLLLSLVESWMLRPLPSLFPAPPPAGAILDQDKGQQDGSSRRAPPVMWPQRPSQPPMCANLLGGLRAWHGRVGGSGEGQCRDKATLGIGPAMEEAGGNSP